MTDAARLTLARFGAAGLIAFGLLNVLVLIGPLSGVMDAFIDLTHWPLDGAEAMASPDGRLWIGISGGLLTAMGVMAWQVLSRVWPRSPEEAKAIILPAYLGWFAIDSLGSIAAGAWFNVVPNLFFLALLAGPLVVRAEAEAA